MMSFQRMPQCAFKPTINRKFNQMILVIGTEAFPDGVVLRCLNENPERSHLAVQTQHNAWTFQSFLVLCFVTFFFMGVLTSGMTTGR
jgi:hypothetical protein